MTFSADALASTATLTAGDNLVGGSGTDTLNVTISGSAVTDAGETVGLTLTGVEKVLVSNFETDASGVALQAAGEDSVLFDLSNVDSSLTTVGTLNSSNVEADTYFTNVAKIVDAEMAGKGDMKVAYAASVVSGISDAMTLTANGTGVSGTNATVKVAGIETLNIVSSTATNYLTVEADDYTTINVTGTKDLTVTVSDTDVTSFDASTASGVISADLSAITLANLDTVNGGTATTDKLTIAGSVTVNSTTNDLSAVSGFERLKISDAATVTLAANTAGIAYIDFSDADDQVLTLNSGYTSDTTVVLTGDASANNDTITNSANVTLTVLADVADIDGTTDITGGTGSDTLALTADSGTATLTNVRGVETITISAGTNGTEDATVDFNSTDAVVGADKTLAINASALTNSGARLVLSNVTETNGFLSVVGGAGNDNITVGSLADTVSGGAHNDTIDAGAGDDVISGDAGDDSITAGDGYDSLSGGAGNDEFVLSTNLTSQDTIDGGSGTDTLSVGVIDSSAFTNVTNVENLALTGGGTATLTADMSFTSVDLSLGATTEVITLSTGYTNATTVALDAGDKVVNSANVTLTVTANGAGLTSATTITGGTGTDSITVTNDGSTVDYTNVTKIDAVTVLDSASAGDDITFALGSYATAMSINASALNGTNERLLVTGGSASKNLSITGGAGNDSIASGSGNDSIVAGGENDTINSGSGNDYISGDEGEDTFVIASGNLTYQDTIAGGAGNDLIQVDTTSAVTDVEFMHVTSVETVEIVTDTTGALTLSTYASAAGVANVIGLASGANTVSAVGMSTGLTITAATTTAKDDVLTGGTGNDTFVFSGTTGLQDGDTISGTSGTDVIRLDNTSGAVTAEIDLDDVTAIDQVVVYDNDGGNAATSQNIALTFSALSLTTSQTLVVNASAITDSDDALSITNSAGTSTHGTKFSITGGAGNDALVGSYLADTIVGGSNNDTITGNVGADSMTGGSGNDTFVLNTGDSTSLKTDVISDFEASGDKLKIVLSAADVGATGTVDLTDKGDASSHVDAIALLGASQIGQYYFNTTTGQLVVDLDGNGIAQSSDMYITLSDETGISDTDIRAFITGGTGANTITTGGGNDRISSIDGKDSINAGAGDDVLSVTAAADLDNDTQLVGGSGTDTLVLGAHTIDLNNLIAAYDDLEDEAGIEQLVLTHGGTTTILGDTLDGDATKINTIAAGDVTIDLGTLVDTNFTLANLVFTSFTYDDGTDGVALGSGDIIISQLAASTSFIGSSITDKVTAGATASTIVGGAGADSITGNTGIDIIKWTATTAASMATEAGTSAGVQVDFSAGVTGDKVATWSSATDKLHFAAALVTNALGTETDTLLEITKGGTVSNAARFVQITDTAAADNVDTHAGAVTILNSLTTSAVAIGDSFIVAMDNDTNTYLYLVEQVSTANTIAEQDVTLIGMIASVTNPANGDFVSF